MFLVARQIPPYRLQVVLLIYCFTASSRPGAAAVARQKEGLSFVRKTDVEGSHLSFSISVSLQGGCGRSALPSELSLRYGAAVAPFSFLQTPVYKVEREKGNSEFAWVENKEKGGAGSLGYLRREGDGVAWSHSLSISVYRSRGGRLYTLYITSQYLTMD